MPFLKKYRWKLALICLMMGATALIDILMPVYQKEAISRFILPKTAEGLIPYAFIYLGIILFQALNVIIFARLAMSSEMLIGRDIRSSVFRRLQELSFSYYNVTPVGYILARTMNDVNKIASQMSWGIVDIFWSFFYVAGVFITMLAVDLTLGLLLMVLVPVIAVATVYFQKRILNANREVRRQNSRMTGAYNAGISGARTAKTVGVE